MPGVALTIPTTGSRELNVGMIVVVGCVLGTVAIVYQGTMAGASPVSSAASSATSTASPRSTAISEPTALARAASPTATPTSSPSVAPKLSLEQLRGLARPGASAPAGARLLPVEPRAGTPDATATGSVATPTTVNESGQPPASTATPRPSPDPSETPLPAAPHIATPPPLPPPPEGWAPRAVPTEQPR